eukprot:scaffold7016_cov123-Isochrysis_galbana.AAC.11
MAPVDMAVVLGTRPPGWLEPAALLPIRPAAHLEHMAGHLSVWQGWGVKLKVGTTETGHALPGCASLPSGTATGRNGAVGHAWGVPSTQLY